MYRITLSLVFTFLAILFLLPTPRPIIAKHGMVVSEQKIASQVGVDILRAGGNAIDAAVAVGYALAVVAPCCGNIGGGGFMVIHLANGNNFFINFREKAPLAANKNMFLDAQGNIPANLTTKGYLAVGVPGTVLGLDTALNLYGTMSRQQVMAPAIQLAEQGFRVTPQDAQWFRDNAKDFHEQANVAAIFLHDDKPYAAGELLKQPKLAQTLKLVAMQGSDAFYNGPIAKQIVAASAINNGILSLKDFANYEVEFSAPISCNYHNYTIYSAAPPSSGGIVLCESLNILKHFPLHEVGLHSTFAIRNIIEAMRFSYADRNNKLGDPDFVKNPNEQLLSEEYAITISQKINSTTYALSNQAVTLDHSKTDTTHYSVVDDKGNAVAVTYTLNGFFGAKVIAGQTGFFLNDEMDDFAIKPGAANSFNLIQSDANAIEPGKRPLSSMTPTIVMQNNRVVMVLGSRGGPRISSSVLLTVLNVLDANMNIQQAVAAPRYHYQVYPDTVYYEPFAIPIITRLQLRYRGYDFTLQEPWSAVEAIAIDPATQTFYGANDPRSTSGAAIGY